MSDVPQGHCMRDCNPMTTGALVGGRTKIQRRVQIDSPATLVLPINPPRKCWVMLRPAYAENIFCIAPSPWGYCIKRTDKYDHSTGSKKTMDTTFFEYIESTRRHQFHKKPELNGSKNATRINEEQSFNDLRRANLTTKLT